MEKFESRVIVSGVGLSDTGRGVDRSGLDLALDAALAAIADAGLRPEDIDGLASMPFGDRPPEEITDALGLRLDWMGGAGSGAQLGVMINAAMAIASGLCRHVLVYRSVQQLGGMLGSATGALPAAEGAWEWHVPFHEYSAVNLMAMQARRHMHQYGTTKEQLGWIAITGRRHAALNDKAVLRSAMTMEDYLNAPMISDPLGRLDCDLPIDGAVGLVLSAADFAPDCPNPPVRFEAVGCANHGPHGWEPRLDFPAMGAKDAATQMWSRTDLKPTDVQVAEIYDGFTVLTLSWLEALGFCREGEGGGFVDGGQRIRLGGELPLNTYGGQLSAGRLHGFWLFHEAVLQLRGHAGQRQVPGAEVAVTSAGGGFRCGCILLTA
jgi:acetyl-CoA acetyltransferase